MKRKWPINIHSVKQVSGRNDVSAFVPECAFTFKESFEIRACSAHTDDLFPTE
ncbi:MAG: hypothetical protein GX260_00815 [Tissierellia bacterium]|nr:hypothetical protein [Tissierellia bacterium]